MSPLPSTKTLKDMQLRKLNIVVTGLPETGDTESDRSQFIDLCTQHLCVKPCITGCFRLGRDGNDQPRRLLVKLRSEQSANETLKDARKLRSSSDAFVRNVYVNRDLSPQERQLAFEARCRKRQRLAADQLKPSAVTKSAVGILSPTIPYYEVRCSVSDSAELVAVDIMFGSCKYRFVNVYRPPSYGSNERLCVQELSSCINKLSSVKWPVAIAGDLNCPDVNWGDSTSPCDGVQDKLLDCFCEPGTVQLVNDVTCNNHVLDLVLTNEPLIFPYVSVDAPFASSDHNMVWFTVAVHRAPVPLSDNRPMLRYCWDKADFNGLNDRMANFDWSQMMMVNFNADTLWTSFSQELQSAINDFVPVRYVSYDKRVIVKYPAHIRAALARKQCLWQLRKRYPNDIAISNGYRKSQAECRKLIREYEIKREEAVIRPIMLVNFTRLLTVKWLVPVALVP